MASTGSSSSIVGREALPAGVDVVVGLVSHNDVETIAAVSEAVQQAMHRFGDDRCRLVWADSGSTDGTVARAGEALAGSPLLEVVSPPTTTEFLALPYHGVPAKAHALRAVLSAALRLGSRACVVIDAGVPTVAPQWIDWLAGPILAHDCDFVLSYYSRSPHEGALTKGLVYPLVRALYGVRVRQPAAAEFACSARMLQRLLDEDLWDGEGAQIGIDLWITTCAAASDVRMAEAALGVRAHASHIEETADLETTLTQVVGALFADVERRAQQWQRVRGSVAVQRFGEAPSAASTRRASVDVARLIESYRLGYRELRDIWTWVLPTKTIIDLGRSIEGAAGAFSFPDDLWARIVYDFTIAYRLRVLPREHLLRSMVPLYLGWLASFVLQVRERSEAEVDDRVELLAETFEAQKPYLIAKWRWPERLRT